MGLLAAVEQWVKRDHSAEWEEWERRLQHIEQAALALGCGVSSLFESHRERKANVAPELTLRW
jgi:hypothetical protein|eukprot:SAG25_NODE_400_length_8482_cov_73.962901_6_plen_63_part_00